MKSEYKMSIGAVLATFGALGIVLSLLLPIDLGRPLDFLLGFAVGVCSGLGAVLSLNGLMERRRRESATNTPYSDR
jgi:NhaP-type Na+/H+ or K+/H+ antiporter